jgi:hypothetical protein
MYIIRPYNLVLKIANALPNLTRVIKCNPSTYFPNVFFAIRHAPLAMMFVYYRWVYESTATRLKHCDSYFFLKIGLSLSLNWAPCHEGVLESGDIDPRILDLGTRWRWVVNFTPRPLYPWGRSPWYPLDRRLGGPQSLSERGGEEKNSQSLPGLEHPIIQPVAQHYTTELPGSSHHTATDHKVCC